MLEEKLYAEIPATYDIIIPPGPGDIPPDMIIPPGGREEDSDYIPEDKKKREKPLPPWWRRSPFDNKYNINSIRPQIPQYRTKDIAKLALSLYNKN